MPRTTLLIPFLLLACALPGAGARGPAAARMTPELLWKLRRVGAPELAPDGGRLVFTITSYDLAKNAGNSDLWLMDVASGGLRQLTTHEKSDSAPRWAPDGAAIGFLSSRDGKPQVYAISPDGGEAVRLTDVEEGVANFDFSPDGGFISYTSKVRLDPELKETYPDLDKASARIIDGLLYRHWDEWYDGTYSHLFVQPRGGGAAVDLLAGERVHTPLVPFGGRQEIAWSPDGRELCYTAKKGADPAASTDSDLYVVPREGGPAHCITEGMDGFDRHPLYSPDGRFIAFHSMQRAGFEADRERLMLYERSTGAIRELPRGFAHWVQEMVWSGDSRGLYFTAPVQGTVQAFQVDLEGNVRQVTAGRHDLAGIALLPDGSALYAQKSTTERPHELVRIGARDGALAVVTGVNDEIYAGLALPKVETRTVKAADGADLHCLVVYPPDFDPSLKHPLLTYCQGGPQSPITQWFSYRWNFHLMAANGYIVVAPSRRGLPGFGQEWNDAISRDWGGQAMQDYLAATDAMFQEPFVDRSRAGAVGASFGGYSVYWLMGHDQDDRFAAMVAHCGLFNLESWAGTTEELWFADFDVGPPYWQGAEIQAEYDRNSPHRFVDQWDTPLLVIHGEKDYRVPVAEGMQAFTAAQRRGVASRFLYFPEEGHWVLGPQNGVLWHRVFFDWLDRYLKPPASKS